jgi:hypothetical protein
MFTCKKRLDLQKTGVGASIMQYSEKMRFAVSTGPVAFSGQVDF